MILTTIISDPLERSRFIKFAIVGAVGAVVDFAIFNLLIEVIHLQPIPSSVLSFMAAVTSNFTWNRLWTYPDSRTKKLWKQLGEFTIVNVLGLGIRTPVFAISGKLLVSLLEKSTLFPIGKVTVETLSHNIALAIAIVIVMFWNFFINRYWTFNDVDREPDTGSET